MLSKDISVIWNKSAKSAKYTISDISNINDKNSKSNKSVLMRHSKIVIRSRDNTGQLIRCGFSKDSSNINPSVWIRLTLSTYGLIASDTVFRATEVRNGAILGNSPLNILSGYDNLNNTFLYPTG